MSVFNFFRELFGFAAKEAVKEAERRLNEPRPKVKLPPPISDEEWRGDTPTEKHVRPPRVPR